MQQKNQVKLKKPVEVNNTMSDTISKYWEMVEDGKIDKDFAFKKRAPRIISEGDLQAAYRILVEFPEEAILEAARILRSGK